jgi:hypothetical protein
MDFDKDTKIIFSTGKEALDVLTEMKRVCDYYGCITVADMYDLAARAVPDKSWKYGWIDVSKAEVIEVEGGYTINLPKPVPIA